MKTVLSVQSQVANARVGNSVAVFAMERLGVSVIALPTTLLGRRPDRGAPGGGPIPGSVLETLVQALKADGALANVSHILTGYLASAEQADVILGLVASVKDENPRALWVCDPVIGDEGRAYVKSEVSEASLRKFAPEADVLTPNLWEMETIAGRSLPTLKEAHAAAKDLGKTVLVTSAPCDGAGVLYVAPTGSWMVETQKLPGAPKGAGDLFTSLFVARRALGQSVVMALEGAAGATHDVIARSLLDASPHLATIAAQDKLDHPDTWPQARPYKA